jgi:hypothetical protein
MREYTVGGANITVANASPVTLVAIMPAAGQSIEILRCWASWHGNVTSLMQRILLGTKVTAFQTVTNVEPQKTKRSDPISLIVGATTIAAGKCGINASAEGAGAVTPIINDAFNVLNGYLWIPTPKETIIISGGAAEAFVMQFPAATVDLAGWNFGVTFAELG